MKCIAAIPARLDSTRFPHKLMQLLGNQTVIFTTYQAAVQTGLFEEVWVITDAESIYNEIISKGGKAIFDNQHYETGSDRIAAKIEEIDADIIINIQGDEPFVNKNQLQALIEVLQNDLSKRIDVATLKIQLDDEEAIKNPNQVKVVTNLYDEALFFSRLPIPYNRDNNPSITYYKHIGIYAFRKNALIRFKTLSKTMNECAENLENLRMLDNGFVIKVLETDELSIGIDTPEDLLLANKLIKK